MRPPKHLFHIYLTIDSLFSCEPNIRPDYSTDSTQNKTTQEIKLLTRESEEHTQQTYTIEY